MKTVCMIPARSGSKRIPKKNSKDFLGKPIITYPIETAKASGIFDDIVVYTDSEDIKQVAQGKGLCTAIHRPVATDNEILTETALQFVEMYNDHGKFNIDYLCILLPTAVFVDKWILNDGASFLVRSNMSYDCSITFCKYSHPTERAFRIEDNNAFMIDSRNEFIRTQDIKDSYYDAGQMYFFNVKSFLDQKKIFMKNIYPVIIDAVDIDNPEDWEKAEACYAYKNGVDFNIIKEDDNVN